MPPLTPLQRLEMAAIDLYWLPPDVTIHDEVDLLWTVCDRDNPTFNAVYRANPHHPDPDSLVTRVVDTHERFESRWQMMPSFRSDALERAARRGGYALKEECESCVALVDTWAPKYPVSFHVERVMTVDGVKDMIHVTNTVFNARADTSDDALRFQLQQCVQPNARTMRFVAYDRPGGIPVGAAGLAINPKASFALLWAGSTLAEFRGRGVYAALVAARMRALRDLGIVAAGLFAVTTTSWPIMSRQGFQGHGRMLNFARPASQHQSSRHTP